MISGFIFRFDVIQLGSRSLRSPTVRGWRHIDFGANPVGVGVGISVGVGV